jgi:hypothetical protein
MLSIIFALKRGKADFVKQPLFQVTPGLKKNTLLWGMLSFYRSTILPCKIMPELP